MNSPVSPCPNFTLSPFFAGMLSPLFTTRQLPSGSIAVQDIDEVFSSPIMSPRLMAFPIMTLLLVSDETRHA